jgi:polysaccharide export outer membrane protein
MKIRSRFTRTAGRLLLATTIGVVRPTVPEAFAGQSANARGNGASAVPVASVTAPSDYVIGPDDVLAVVFWREKELSSDVVVRPDGKISLPLLNDVQAAGLTPEQLRQRVTEQAGRFVKEPQATVVVREINSRKVYITGQVEKPGAYTLTTRMSVMQLIAMAGGLKEYAKRDRIVVMRLEGGREVRHLFDYEKVFEGKDGALNLDMRPGDTVVVP